jgi:hypothetical protein
VAGGERADSLITGEGRVADKRGPLARGRAVTRERERARLMGGVESSARGGECGAGGRERWAAWAMRGARKGGRGGGIWAGIVPAGVGGEEKFPFLFFSFPISKSILLSFFNLLFPLNNYLSTFLGCQNILCEVLLTTIVYAYDE